MSDPITPAAGIPANDSQPMRNDEEYILSLLGRIAELENLVYVPGLWRCPKCKCGVHSTVMSAVSGAMRANVEPQRCPNDCGPMWRVTERDAGNELADQMNATRNATLEQAATMCEAYVKSPIATVLYFMGRKVEPDRTVSEETKRAAGRELAKLIRELKGPA